MAILKICKSMAWAARLILQPFSRFTYVTAHSPTLQLLHLRHSSFYNPSVDSPVTGTSPTSPGEPPMIDGHIDDISQHVLK